MIILRENPLNSEPPLDSLTTFITPNHLHYVRNHGKVPKNHPGYLAITGISSEPIQLPLSDLHTISPPISITCTFACDGKRRKEMQLINPSTSGVPFSSAAILTATFTGHPLHLIISHLSPPPTTQYIHFTGADILKDNQGYGTALPLSYLSDPVNQVILATHINNEPLSPDHGYPIRLIIPGYVGGRNVKWVSTIHFSPQDSSNWFHLNDNRLEPGNIFITELNLDSCITSPVNPISIKSLDQTISIQGYAHTGSHRTITLIQLGLHHSTTEWLDVPLSTPSKPFVWSTFTYEIPILSLLSSQAISIRAFDSSCNSQPETSFYNPGGYMGNGIYTISLSLSENQLHFHHPVKQGPISTPSPSFDSSHLSEISPQDLTARLSDSSKHYLQIDHLLLDVTSFISQHPGGPQYLLENSQKDMTETFHQIHSPSATQQMRSFAIARLPSSSPTTPPTSPPSKCFKIWGRKSGDKTIALSQKRWVPIILLSKTQLSHDTYRFHFSLPNPSSTILHLETGRHIQLAAHTDPTDPNHLVVRSYTPVNPIFGMKEDGTFDLVIKIYRGTPHQPPGILTSFLENFPTSSTQDFKQILQHSPNSSLFFPSPLSQSTHAIFSSTLWIKGPTGNHLYLGNGHWEVEGHFQHASRLNLICAGSGITPIYQVVKKIAIDNDPTQVSMIYANKTLDDILLLQELSNLPSSSFKIWYVVDESPVEKSQTNFPPHSVGHVNTEMISTHLFPPDSDTMTFICGPPGFVQKAILPGLESLGHDDEHLYEF